MAVADAQQQSVEGNGVGPTDGPRQVVRRMVASQGARQGVLALVDQCLVSGTTFLTMMILARVCTQADLGIYSLCFSIVMFACVMQERSLAAPYLVFSHQRQGESAERLLGSTFVHQTILALTVAAAVLIYFGYLLWSEGFTPMGASVLALAMAAVPMMMRDFLRNVSFAHLRMSSALLIDSLVFCLQLGGLAALALGGGLTIAKVYLVISGACCVASVVWLLSKRQPWAIRWTEVIGDWKSHWGYSRWLVFGRLLGNGSRVCMPWIVAGVVGLSPAGVLAACVTLTGISWVFVRGMNNLLQTRAVRAFHRTGKGGLTRELWRTAIFYIVVLGNICLVYLLAGRWLLEVLFGESFGWAAPALVLLGVNSLVTSLAMTSSNGLAALQRPKGTFLGEAATFLATVVTAVPLVLGYGITGAAAAMVAGALASFLVMTTVLARELRRTDTA